MVSGAVDAGLDTVGFTDHCSLTAVMRAEKLLWNRNFDRTYEQRRAALDILDDRHDITLQDGVEMDYEPGLEADIERFLDTAGFDYAIGSVHYTDGREVFPRESFAEMSPAETRGFVDTYYDTIEALIESELFEIVGHVDRIEWHPALRGLTTESHYRQVAAACADSRTVPEINASHVSSDPEMYHPSRPFIDVLREYDVRFTVGTDSHEPGAFGPRREALETLLAERDVDPVDPVGL